MRRAPMRVGLMMRRLWLAPAVALALAAAPAHAGTPITALPKCENSYLYFQSGVSREQYRAALLCLVNGARAAQHLPALKRSAPLEEVGQSQSDKFAASGSGSHGKSLTDITKRFAKRGYRAAAYNEGFAVLGGGASPYAFLANMVAGAGVPCTEIFDPRFRDVGIGVSSGALGGVTTLALEFGRKAGTSQPSSKTKPAATCGHKVPKPLVTGRVIEGQGLPTVTDTAVTVQLTCSAPVACALTAALSLPNAKADAPAQTLTIGAGQTLPVTYGFDPAAIGAEKAAAVPRASVTVKVTSPAQYSDVLTARFSG